MVRDFAIISLPRSPRTCSGGRYPRAATLPLDDTRLLMRLPPLRSSTILCPAARGPPPDAGQGVPSTALTVRQLGRQQAASGHRYDTRHTAGCVPAAPALLTISSYIQA